MDEPAPQPQQPQAQPAKPHPNNHGRLHNILRNRRRSDRWQRRLGGQQRPAAGPQQQQAMAAATTATRTGTNYQPQSQPYMGQQPVPQQAPQPAQEDTMGHIGRSRHSTRKNWSHITMSERMNQITVRRITRNIPISLQSMLENHVSQYQAV